MTKYIISSGTSVVSELLENGETISVQVTNEAEKAIFFDTIGKAMLEASKVNKTLGSHHYMAMPVEV